MVRLHNSSYKTVCCLTNEKLELKNTPLNQYKHHNIKLINTNTFKMLKLKEQQQ